ncbi:hypothetical protein QWZ02_09330 [Kinneretia asaccharophila]|uniref:Uncharacterized protein n=1 Tax=Roseateles asaccharophilus TaxID=582607 RepID=A0A4R6N455_9BURK|nr:hypothetical protein [Roseateles asaccharophilus]MDN3544648.1 hypothetical protein [Roseateles asaccharophilus]TDP09587.1 hypothetical protein DFR39_104148 [Roseateles asaccharophilus]
MPRYTTKTGAGCASIHSEPGRVIFNGAALMPHEAAMLADALNDCAERAEQLGELAAKANRLNIAGIRAGQPLAITSGG